MTDDEIYQKFIEYMSNPVFGFTESEHKMPMITSFITPEEAEFLTGFPTSEASLDEIADLKDTDPAELEVKARELRLLHGFLLSLQGASPVGPGLLGQHQAF